MNVDTILLGLSVVIIYGKNGMIPVIDCDHFLFLGMLPNMEYERKLLGQHNPGTSPVKKFITPSCSPHVTPTKNYGDRFIPLRQPNEEWVTRYSSIVNADQERPIPSRAAGGGSVPGSTPTNSGSPSNQYNSNQSSGGEDTRQDQMVVRALLRNELLQDRIDDIRIWDVHTQKMTMELAGHTSRVGCLAWNGDLICSGSRDRHIIQRDLRQANVTEKKMSAHRQEVVCGLKWSPDKQYLVCWYFFMVFVDLNRQNRK
uniref:WD_REPEATS_REGION domain-containing protein n=1 Tax=Heterorhabditis bacteriophora TaxID=37862 RepID=A0A1I7XES6_HETBA